ncbi:hypothetical protein TNCV_2829051 [Trichonephila clavipes]|nr:hypothetical protein TNCV_2829051 [Trichonephila clavipes]
MPPIGGYHQYGLASIITGLESSRACLADEFQPRQLPPTRLSELRRALLNECCNITQDQTYNLIAQHAYALYGLYCIA